MQGIITVMTQVGTGIKAEGSYFILLLAALYILYRINGKKNQWYIYYILLTQVLVVVNPIVVLILSKAFCLNLLRRSYHFYFSVCSCDM